MNEQRPPRPKPDGATSKGPKTPELSDRPVLHDFISPVSFWTAAYHVESAWLDHAPFAFWLIEAAKPGRIVELGSHNGYSYFAFCQAVKRLGLKTSCYAVDHWQGDEHAGYYADETYQRVNAYNTEHYIDFSRLVRSTFDDAVGHFEDGSIDLLHIDGRHFYDDVKHDFESWVPKLSSRAVVLFHDINVRERDFGVARFWSELSEDYPSFAFLHGHGLGVLGFGPDQPDAMRNLYSAAVSDDLTAQIREVYSRLGSPFKAKYDHFIRENELANASEMYRRQAETFLSRAEQAEEHRDHHQKRADILEESVITLSSELSRHQDEAGREISSLTLERDRLLQQNISLKKSLSWRITKPLRAARRMQSAATSKLKRGLLGSAKVIYDATPLPLSIKRALARRIVLVVRLVRPGFNPRTFKTGDTTNRLGIQRGPVNTGPEVAVAIEDDPAIGVPFPAEVDCVNPPRLAVVLHLYFEPQAAEFRRYFSNIPFPFDLFISTDTEEKRQSIARVFPSGLFEGRIDIRVVENRGRDIAPKLIGFRDIYGDYDLVLHVHSKRSGHHSALAVWRQHLLMNLMGSPDIVRSIVAAFQDNESLGMVAPQHFEPMRHWLGWGNNFATAKALASRLGIDLNPKALLDFPSGSMFWARPTALKPLLDLNLETAEFPAEQGQIDGTLAHAIEHLYFYVCEKAGLRWIKAGDPALFDHTPNFWTVKSATAISEFIEHKAISLLKPGQVSPRAKKPEPIDQASAELVARSQRQALGQTRERLTTTKVAIGLVTFHNSEEQLSRFKRSVQKALARIAGTTAGQLYVVDNGGGVDAFWSGAESCTVLPSDGNVGFGAAHNRLMKQAFDDGADVYIPANPDGAFHPTAIENMLRMIEVHHGLALIEATQFPVEHPKTFDPFSLETSWACAACIAIPKAIYEVVGGFDTSFFLYCEDVDYAWRVRAMGFPVLMCPTAHFFHPILDRNHSKTTLEHIYTSAALLARKWHDPEFEATAVQQLKSIGKPPPDAKITPVPEHWASIADFENGMIFAPKRY